MAIQVYTPDNALTINSIIFYLYTDPGIGKSTLAHTAKNAVIFDFDIGQHRVAAHLKHGTIIRGDSWLDFENLKDDFLGKFDTFVFDTPQAMLNMIRLHLSRIAGNTQHDGSLTLKAQGLANKLFEKFITRIRSFNKNIVFIAHAVESEAGKDKNRIVRPDLDGKNAGFVYRMADVMGYIHSQEDQNGVTVRNLYLNPASTHHGKNSGNLGNMAVIDGVRVCTGIVNIPDLERNPKFLQDLIDQAISYINTLTPAQAQLIKQKQDADLFAVDCDAANYASDINILSEQLLQDKAANHPYYEMMKNAIGLAINRLKLKYDPEKQRFYEVVEKVGERITEDQKQDLIKTIDLAGWNIDGFCLHHGINTLDEIEQNNLARIKSEIDQIAIGNVDIPEPVAQ